MADVFAGCCFKMDSTQHIASLDEYHVVYIATVLSMWGSHRARLLQLYLGRILVLFYLAKQISRLLTACPLQPMFINGNIHVTFRGKDVISKIDELINHFNRLSNRQLIQPN